MPRRKKQKISQPRLAPREPPPQPSQPEPPKAFPFLKLPAELREEVYSYLLPNTAISIGYRDWITTVDNMEEGGGLGQGMGWEMRHLFTSGHSPDHTFDFTVFLVCHQLNEEASSMFYKNTHLQLFLSVLVNATQEDNGAGPSSAKYQLRSRKIYPDYPPLIFSHILGRFRRVTVHYNLGRAALEEKPSPFWKLAGWHLEDVAAAMARHYQAGGMKPELKICFWEPSIMSDNFPVRARTACHVSFIRVVHMLQLVLPTTTKDQHAKQVMVLSRLPEVRHGINRALVRVSTRHEHQRRAIGLECDIVDDIQEEYGQQLSISFARDWHHLAPWTFHPALQPLYIHADDWLSQWYPEQGDGFISDSELEATFADIEAGAALVVNSAVSDTPSV